MNERVVVIIVTPKEKNEGSYILGIVEAFSKDDITVSSFVEDALKSEDSSEDEFVFTYRELSTDNSAWIEIPRLEIKE